MSLATLLQGISSTAFIAALAAIAAHIVAYVRGSWQAAVRLGDLTDLLLVAGWVLSAAAAFLGADWVYGAFSAAMAVLVAWLWWRRYRRRRQRTPKLAGYKARAALAKLAQRAREAAKPRPVLRPVPGGAR